MNESQNNPEEKESRLSAQEVAARTARLQAAMHEAGLDGVFATQNADVYYLTGVMQQAQVYVPEAGAPVLLVRKHLGRAQADSVLDASRVIGVRSLRELPDIIVHVGGRAGRIGLELDTLPTATYFAYQKALAPLGVELVDASMLVRQVRAVKSEYEVLQIRLAAEISEAGLRAAAENLREGITELELASLVEAEMRRAGHSGIIRMRYYGQEMHIGHLLAGESGSLPSFMNSPTGGEGPGPWAPYGAARRPIARGEPVLLDYCGEWAGYLADQTRMLSIGPLSSFWRDAYEAMCDVLACVQRDVRPGMTSGDVFDLAEQRAISLGYGDNFMGPPEHESPGQKVPFVGHGVGLELDEWPPLQRGTTAPLRAGMVLAVEPKLIFSGKGAIGLEDTFLLTTEGMQPLTFSRRDIVEV